MMEKNNNGEYQKNYYIAYDYKEVHAGSSKVSFYMDCYESFGWQIDESTSFIREKGYSSLRLKRDRKIVNKQELIRLEKNFDDCLNQITRMEVSVNSKATMYSIMIGIIGTAFLAGSVFAVTATPPIIWLCILLGIPGIIGWVLPLFLYRIFALQRETEIKPLINEKYDEIYEICRKAQKCLV